MLTLEILVCSRCEYEAREIWKSDRVDTSVDVRIEHWNMGFRQRPRIHSRSPAAHSHVWTVLRKKFLITSPTTLLGTRKFLPKFQFSCVYKFDNFRNAHVLQRVVRDLSACLSGQCYPSHKKCDGIRDCDDGTDEGDCFQIQLNEDKDLFEFLSLS
ncbi:uncharacterized protein CEXT_280941 [Caerostris extrusa]|uniref:Uncharacterized protein n=1 Tax=Caerostris extrusa TaxID=172846 RepID=A0AAV4M8L8_CAEEX|nr:uncharacterized protein CEXT_280941 [Caerostris extrusa]